MPGIFWTDSTKALWGLSANKFLSVYVKRNCLPTQTLIKNWTICSQRLLGDIPAPTGIPIWETEPAHHTFIYQHKQRLSEQTLWYHTQRISNTFSYPLQTGMEYLLKYRHNLLYYQWLVYIMPFFTSSSMSHMNCSINHTPKNKTPPHIRHSDPPWG